MRDGNINDSIDSIMSAEKELRLEMIAKCTEERTIENITQATKILEMAEENDCCKMYTSAYIKNVDPGSPIFDGGHLPTIPLEVDKMTITFTETCGKKSWYVNFEGIYDNQRGNAHVELRIEEDVLAGIESTAYHTMIPGSKYQLVELHRTADSVAWVKKPYKSTGQERDRQISTSCMHS